MYAIRSYYVIKYTGMDAALEIDDGRIVKAQLHVAVSLV